MVRGDFGGLGRPAPFDFPKHNRSWHFYEKLLLVKLQNGKNFGR